ncbi:MAG: type I methionyl aminopeptidase [Alphaproteobacteria bacterium]|jgi:methionyl aminopeptidase|nr:type I methionyl aminopeptidase [Rhodospirillaceae bacterium]MBT6202759.1 type I methionyl aminopeptidase [Rhodospirillaceae bacterium]MBT7612495.1 type I methionyl aminopeptidase [Rhodospirillaceae bacterium]MBT7646115.1 type I methionyl aminopeptidase [Rhodospirillaceae bacterium]MDG2482021.1 type I methionyl aminopeptidase [Alphaproteobacteria bacterium]
MEQPQRSASPRITIHGPEAFPKMREAGDVAARTLDMITSHVVPGVTTERLDQLCHEFILDHDAIPAPLNYRGFPKSICTSVNHVICHGIPSADKVLREGDVLNIDVTTIVDGWYGDTSRMFHVGEVKRKASRLAEITFECMWRGIECVRPGARLGDIGHAIQVHAEKQRCSVVRDFCGHGIGQVFHDHPNVVHYGKPGTGIELVPGMFFTIEPMINLGRPDVLILEDGWTAVTRDKSLSAQWEHTIAVTEDGYEVFTLSPAGHKLPPYDA